MIVVSNTTCITTLLKAGRDDILSRSFETILIPPAVHTELTAFHTTLPPWLIRRELVQTAALSLRHLGAGEAEAITLARPPRGPVPQR